MLSQLTGDLNESQYGTIALGALAACGSLSVVRKENMATGSSP